MIPKRSGVSDQIMPSNKISERSASSTQSNTRGETA
jgi:hypothetical protein